MNAAPTIYPVQHDAAQPESLNPTDQHGSLSIEMLLSETVHFWWNIPNFSVPCLFWLTVDSV